MKKILAILSILIIFLTGCGNEVKQEAAEKIQETAGEVKETAAKVEQKAAKIAGDEKSVQNVTEKFSLGGILPGMTLEEVKNILGEPTARHDDDEFIFSNGLFVEIDEHNNVVKEIQTHQAGVKTGAGVEVGMSEQKLIDAYGAADKVENHDGKTEYKYRNADGLFKIEFEIFNGNISEIKIQLDD